MIALHNHSNKTQYVNHDERIAQSIILLYINVEFIEKDILTDTKRGTCGFGSRNTGD